MKIRLLALAGSTLVLVPQAALAEVIVSPRVSYFFDNVNQRASGLDDAATLDEEDVRAQTEILQDLFGPDAGVEYAVDGVGINNDQLALPMYGLAVTLIQGDWSVTATGMYGKGDGTARANATAIQTTSVLGLQATDVVAFNSTGTQQFERIDLELTAQKRINERFAVMGGVRYERVDSVLNGSSNFTISNNASNLISLLIDEPFKFNLMQANSPQLIEGTYEVFSIRGGVAGFIPFGEGNAVFLNGMVHLSHEPATELSVTQLDFVTGTEVTTQSRQGSETTIGPDMAVGVQFSLSDSVSLDVRYRGAFYFPLAGGANFNDVRVNHGVNAGVSFRF
jgi:opacity protein-like surface antigen